VKLVKINNEFLSTGGGKVSFQMGRDGGMIAFVGEEW
jgi:hypothetical protein